jgi:hypothetical protein
MYLSVVKRQPVLNFFSQGYTKKLWNNDGDVSAEDLDWDGTLLESKTKNVASLQKNCCVALVGNERFYIFTELNEEQQAAAKVLGYDEDTWNEGGCCENCVVA